MRAKPRYEGVTVAQMPEDSQALVAVSRFLSRVLRHEPELLGLRIDARGWVAVDELLQKLNRASRTLGALKRVRMLPQLTRELLLEVVEKNDKQRFALSGDGRRIRAVQGHSVDVELGHPVSVPPPTLFHGTAAKNWPAISVQGLKRGPRHAVHLSCDIPTAKRVGARHGRPVVLRVDAGAMHGDGHVFSIAQNGVWLIEYVPPQYLSVVAGSLL